MKQFFLKHRKGILYALYGVLITPLILFICFPSEVIGDFIQSSVNSKNSGIIVTVQKASLSFPVGIKLAGVKCSVQRHPEETVCAAEKIVIRPGIWSLFGKNPEFRFTSQAYGGTITGRINLQKNGREAMFTLSTEFNDIHIDDKSSLPAIITDYVAGNLKGAVTYSGVSLSDPNGTGEAALSLSDGSIKFRGSLLNINAIDFKEALIKADLKDQSLNISNIDFNGNDFLGEASGIINLKNPVEKSRINFKGAIEPTASFIKDSGKTGGAGLLLRQSLKNGKLPFTFNGTMENINLRLM